MNKNVIESVAVEGTETAKQEGDITVQKPYEFKQLCAEHIPLVTNVIKAIGLKEFKGCLNKEIIGEIMKLFKKNTEKDTKTDYTTIGLVAAPMIFDIVEVVLENTEKCTSALFKLLSGTSNLTVEQVKKLPLGDFAEMVYDFVKKDEFPDFFKVVLKLLKVTK